MGTDNKCNNYRFCVYYSRLSKGRFLPGPLPGVPAEDVSLVGLDEDVVPPDVVQDLARRRLRQVGQRVALRLRRKDKEIL